MRKFCFVLVCGLLTVGSALANNSCRYANNGTCDEPRSCRSGTDDNDCGRSSCTPTITCGSCVVVNRTCRVIDCQGRVTSVYTESCQPDHRDDRDCE